jgi:hypothetical protein
MNRREFFRKWKVHFFFGGGLLLILAINVVINFLSGQAFLRATLGASREIRPVEYMMFVLFWYWFARGQKSESPDELTTLKLGGSNT